VAFVQSHPFPHHRNTEHFRSPATSPSILPSFYLNVKRILQRTSRIATEVVKPTPFLNTIPSFFCKRIESFNNDCNDYCLIITEGREGNLDCVVPTFAQQFVEQHRRRRLEAIQIGPQWTRRRLQSMMGASIAIEILHDRLMITVLALYLEFAPVHCPFRHSCGIVHFAAGFAYDKDVAFKMMNVCVTDTG
jgi:hypothetical protein